MNAVLKARAAVLKARAAVLKACTAVLKFHRGEICGTHSAPLKVRGAVTANRD